MAKKKLAAAIEKTGGVREMVDRESIETLSDEELRNNIFASRDTEEVSTQEAIANDNRRASLMRKMGFDFFDIESIDPHPENSYSLNEEEIQNLAVAIHESGNTTPIVIREKPDGRYELLGGERRWRAHKILAAQYGDAWRMIPGRNMGAINDEQALFVLHSDNLSQRELTPSERAYGFEVIYDRISKQRATDPEFKEKYKGKKTYDILAEQFHVSTSAVKNEIAISRGLHSDAKELLDAGKIGKVQAVSMAHLPEEKQEVVLATIGKDGLDNGEIDNVIKQVKAGESNAEEARATSRKKERGMDSYLKAAHRSLKKAYRSQGSADYVLLGQIKNLIKEIEARDKDW